LKFDITNTLPDTVLENVSVISTPDDDESGLVEDFIIPAPVITNAQPAATIYVSFSRSDPAKFDIANFSNILRFTSKEVDPESGEPEAQGYDDEYEVEMLTLGAGDYFLPTYIGNFQGTWDSLGAHNEVSDTFSLSSMKSIQGTSPPLSRLPLSAFLFRAVLIMGRSDKEFDRLAFAPTAGRNRSTFLTSNAYHETFRPDDFGGQGRCVGKDGV